MQFSTDVEAIGSRVVETLRRRHSSVWQRLYVLARKVQRNFEDYGWWVATRKSLLSLFEPIFCYQVYRCYRVNLETAQPQVKWQGHGLVFKILGADDEAEIDQIENLAEWLRGSLRKKIAAGGMCLVALQNEKVVGFNLVAFGEVLIPLINLQRTFRKSQTWSEHIAVHRDCRRRGIASQLRYRAFEELRKRGIKRVYAGALRHNVVSLESARKVGHREFVDVRYLKLLGMETWRYKRLKRAPADKDGVLSEDLAA